MAKTNKPTGLKITRNGNKLTLNWKIADKDYGDGQAFGYSIDYQKGNYVSRVLGDTPVYGSSIGTKQTAHTLSITKTNYYPTTKKLLLAVHLSVRGNRKKYTSDGKTVDPTVSDWSSKTYTVNTPHKPKLTVARDSTVENKATFTWTTENDDDSHWFTDTQWETKLFPESSVTKGANLNWSGAEKGTSTANNSKPVPEQTELLANKSYTRWFRIRSRGPAGASDWAYAKHVYATPQTAVIDAEKTWYADNGANGYICYVQFKATSTNAYPIDKATIQYTITTPVEDMQCPDGVSWTDARNIKSTGSVDAVSFSIDSQIGYDQCLYVRVNTQHDIESNVTYGAPVLVNGGVGALSAPSGISVVADDSTHRATITATNNSAVPDSFLVVVYRATDNYEDENVVGYIEHGETTVTVQAPDWSGADEYAFGVYAAVGDIPITRDSALMKSAIVWKGGEVPKAPTNVTVNPTSVSGTIQVTWDWNWQSADGAEISWADHADAWESTDEPETYEIANTKTGRWNISGLETGQTWYVRVRFRRGLGDEATYGAYSDIEEIDLSSAPIIPTLVLSESVIPQDGDVTASWVYSTTDGTPQAYAEIVKATITGQGITYSDPIVSVETEQQVTLNAEDMGWETGDTYNLCVRVVSASGKISDDYSEPVSVTIAEPLEVQILSTSLVSETIETNPRTFEGNPIIFETEMEEDVTKMEIALEPIQLGEGTPSPSNVRPIVGHSEVKVLNRGRNFFKTEAVSKTEAGVTWTINEDGSITVSGTATGYTDIILGKADVHDITGNVCISGVQNATNIAWALVRTLDKNNNVIENISYSAAQQAKIVVDMSQHSDAYYIQVGVKRNNNVATNGTFGIQVELGDTPTIWTPYVDSQTVSQDFNVTLTPTVIDETPYLFKKTGDVRGDRESLELVGGTVNWNQLCGANARAVTSTGVTFTYDSANNAWTASGTANGGNRLWLDGVQNAIAGHILLITTDSKEFDVFSFSNGNIFGKSIIVNCNAQSFISGTEYYGVVLVDGTSYSGTFHINCTDLTAFFGNSATADYVYSLEQANAGAGIAWLRKYFPDLFAYSPYNTGTLESVKPTAHVTRGVNQWDEHWKVGNFSDADGYFITGSTQDVCSENWIPVLPNTTYYANKPVRKFYYAEDKSYIGHSDNSGGTFVTPSNCYYMHFRAVSYGTTYNHDICINISDPDINGKYFPAEHHTYPITELELRGIPKLVDGELKFDGDTRKADGSVSRKYILVDLGTLNYGEYGSTDSVTQYYTTGLDSIVAYSALGISSKFVYDSEKNPWTMAVASMGQGRTYFRTSKDYYASTTAFKTAMSGVYAVFERMSAVTETADPFTDPQEVSIYGTEEFVSSNGVPVGNKTTYKTRDIFGGKIDFASGLLTVEKVIADLGTLNWSYASDGQYFYTKLGETQTGYNYDGLCSHYHKNTGIEPVDKKWQNNSWVGSGYNLIIKDTTYTSDSAFKTAMSGVQLCYPLETPLTYQLTPHEIETLIGSNVVTTEDGGLTVRIAESVRNILALKELPLTVEITEADNMVVAIERADSYHMDRPDETTFDGYEGETVALKEQADEIALDDLIGSLDDGAPYRLVVTVSDDLGQRAETSLDFEVHWEHQAKEPLGEVEIDDEQYIALITPQAPQGARASDVCDIYRLSVDRPELVVRGAKFGTQYVDPYPTIGQFGGYRLVTRTKNGDYITEENQIAWLDINEPLESDYSIIDFDGGQIFLQYGVSHTSDWIKDFTETKYLGGSVQGDWNPAVSRSSKIDASVITLTDQDQMQALHKLSVTPTICHVRTSDGASFNADVHVSENYTSDKYRRIASYTLTITRVDPQRLDGMSKAEWDSLHEEE